ncbi:MAG TPA: hypothetical protein PLR26_07190 [Bacilli bacterium]|nr:hypothetical protein [Bacilli bacterium]
MKKLVLLLVLSLSLFVVAGCDNTSVDELTHLMQFNTYGDPNTDPNAAVIERLTGQKVNYAVLPQTNTDEKLYLDIAGQARYNSMTLTPNQFNKLRSSNALLDISKLLDEHGPNIKSAMSAQTWATATFDDKIFGIPQKNPSENINSALFARMDILAQHGITSLPTTLDGFKTTLQTLKTAGVQIPFCTVAHSIEPIRSAFGIVTEWVPQTNGQIKHWTQTAQYQNYVDYIKDLNTSGLLQEQYLTASTNCQEKFITGDAAFIVSAWWAGNPIYTGIANNKSITIDQFMANPNQYVGYITGLMGANNTKQIKLDRSIVFFIAIPKYMEKEAVATIKWLNAKLDPTNFLEIAIGKEGETFTKTDGKYYPILTPVVDGKTPFDSKNSADWFLTGTREDDYSQYWQARARKLATQQHSWETMNLQANKAFGVYEPLGYAPGFTVWGAKQSGVNQSITDFMTLYMNATNTKTFAEFLTELQTTRGLNDATTEVNVWYQANTPQYNYQP